jgi:hypothetical protein
MTNGFPSTLQITDPETGEIDLKLINLADDEAARERFLADVPLTFENPFEPADTVTGNLVRGVSQFMAPGGAANKALKSAKVLAGGGPWQSMGRWALAGYAADFAAFDPEAERLTDMMDAAGLPIIDYLKSDEDDSEWESRFKNGLEGSVLGVGADMLFTTARALKSTKRVKQGLDERVADLERQDAEAAELIERDVWSQGDPEGPALETVRPPQAETAAEATARRATAPAKEPVINGQKFLDDDWFDLPVDPETQFAIGNSVPDRQRFVAEEVVELPTADGGVAAFRARAGDIYVDLGRNPYTTEVNWDFIENAFSDQPFRELGAGSLKDINEIFSKVGAIVEADAASRRPPEYYFEGADPKLDSIYGKLGPKLAERIGYEFEQTIGGFKMVDPEGVNRPAKGSKPSFEPEAQTPRDEALRSAVRQLDSKFAFDGDAGSFEATTSRMNDLRDAANDAFGDAYRALEADGRVRYARQAGDLEENWARFNSSAQAVTGKDGSVVIFTRNTTPDQMEGLLLHEVGIHSGMRGLVGDKGFDSLLGRVDELVSLNDGPALRARDRVPANTPEANVREETLAYLVQYAPDAGIVKDVVSRVKAGIAKQFPGAIERLGLTENDFRQLAVLSLRNEAIISGQVVAMFGRLGEITEAGTEQAAQTGTTTRQMFQQSPALLQDRLSLGNAMAVRDALDLDAMPEDLAASVARLKDDLLGPGFTERLFAAETVDSPFDPFLWRDTVEALASGDTRPEVAARFKQMVETVAEPDARPKLLTPTEAGFTSTAELALLSPPPRFRDAKALSQDQWIKLFKDGGATKEAFDFQIYPALQELAGPEGSTEKITKELMADALKANRVEVQPESQGRLNTDARGLAMLSEQPVEGKIEADYSSYVTPGTHSNYQQELLLMPEAGKGYSSHNWFSEGVVGHIRTTDRATVDGKKIRFVDELQSDLHQEGAKYGYRDQIDIGTGDQRQARIERAEERYQSIDENTPLETVREYERELDAAYAVQATAFNPPRAPMQDWEKPFIKRVLQNAGRDGLDTVAFTSYETLNPALKNDGTKKFYDERMPAHLKKVAKQLGARVVRVNIEKKKNPLIAEPHKDFSVWAIELNPEARAKLREGVPMFSMKEAPGRLDERLNAVVLDDIKSGRRGLDKEESEALLGAAERWAAAVARQQPSRGRDLKDLINQTRSRNDPADMAEMVAMLDEVKAPFKEPPSLMTFLRKLGGVRDEGGELVARDLQRVKFVNNSSGISMDEALERAWEAGYVGKPFEGDALGPGARPADETRPVFDDLLDAIDREMSGEKVYSIQDYDWVAESAARQDLKSHLESLGLDPSKSKKQVLSEYERIAKWQEGEPLTLKDLQDMDKIEARANAKPGIGLPAKGLLGGEDIRINFNAIKSGDDIKSVIGQLADSFAKEIEGARGATRTNEQVIKDSKRLSAWEALNTRNQDTPLTDAQVPAAQALYIASAENVKQALEQAAKLGTDTAHFAARRALSMHRAVQAEIAGAKADASRALRAWSIGTEATAQARREMQDVMEQYGGKIDPEEMARLKSVLDRDPIKSDKMIRSMGRKASDIAGEVIRFMFLSGPQTHVMNIAGNSLTTVYDIGARFGAGIKGKITGDASLDGQISIALKEYAGLIEGVRTQFRAFAQRAEYGKMTKGLKEAAKTMQEGDLKQGLKQGASTLAMDNPASATFRGRFDDRGVSGRGKYAEGGNDRAISADSFGMEAGKFTSEFVNKLGALVSAPVEFLGFMDDFFKGANEVATRYRVAQETVIGELKSGQLLREEAEDRFASLVENPTEEAIAAARKSAQRRTFTEPVGDATRLVIKGRNLLNSTGLPLGHILLPFVVTPSNILKFAFMNGPTGMLFKEIRDDMAAGGPRRAMAQSRMAAGTGLLMLGMDMVANQQMTGQAPQDPGERELWERRGLQPYSIKIGDKWVSYRRMEPVSTMMAIGADLQTIYQNVEMDDDPDDDAGELWGPVLGAALQVVQDKSFLTGISEFIKFSEDSQMYGASYFDQQTSALMVPALAGQTERVVDPTIREASNAIERAWARIPGLSKDLPASKDIWGRTRHTSSGLGVWYDALSPFTVRTQDPEPIDNELTRIGFYPKRPAKSITVQHPTGVRVAVNLRNRPDIWSRYVELSGNGIKAFDGMGAKDYLNAVISGSHPDAADYQLYEDSSLSPASKEKWIGNIIDKSRQVARFQLEQEFRMDLQAMATASLEAEKQAQDVRQEMAVQ